LVTKILSVSSYPTIDAILGNHGDFTISRNTVVKVRNFEKLSSVDGVFTYNNCGVRDRKVRRGL
jgi:hypothetical protein